MVLFSTTTKRNVRRAGEVLTWIFLLALVLGPWIAWFIGEPYRRHVVREGELCGRAIAGPMLNRGSLTRIYPASLTDWFNPNSAANTRSHDPAIGLGARR